MNALNNISFAMVDGRLNVYYESMRLRGRTGGRLVFSERNTAALRKLLAETPAALTVPPYHWLGAAAE